MTTNGTTSGRDHRSRPDARVVAVVAAACLAMAVFVAVLTTGRGNGPDDGAAPASDVAASPAIAEPAATELDGATVDLGSALYDPADHRGPQAVPVGIRIEALGVDGAPVRQVGVDDRGEMVIPPVDEIGWYVHGAAPQDDQGTTVLAGHVAWDGVAGVLHDLASVQLGAIVEVALDDDTTVRYRIERVDTLDKQALPDELFARTGPRRLVLITCGGEFDPQQRSYDSNVIAYAVPI